LRASLLLAQNPDDLLFREPARLHVHPLTGDGLYSFLEEIPGVTSSFMELLEPLRKQLKLDKDEQSDDVLKALWAIYQQPLRLALIKALLPPSTANTTDNLGVAIEADIQPKFSLILKSK